MEERANAKMPLNQSTNELFVLSKLITYSIFTAYKKEEEENAIDNLGAIFIHLKKQQQIYLYGQQ